LDNQGRTQRLQSNLERLYGALSPIEAVSSESSYNCQAVAQNLPLSHATSYRNMVAICESGSLKSMQKLIDQGILTHRMCAETELGTANGVFFYAGAFSYPATNFGFLFKANIEEAHPVDGGATPFDSGGLVKHFDWGTKTTELPIEFFSRHELPIPDYRRYLHRSFEVLYNRDPWRYLDPEDVTLANDPVKLANGDVRRRRTHEVRIPDSVLLRSAHLVAVFAPKNRIAALPEVRALFTWCRQNKVERRSFDSPGGDDFSGLRSASLDYLREKISLY